MWPWGHLAVAYLLYTLYTHRRYARPPRALPVIALAVGSQFPDLIDKPLGWSLGVLPGGRTLGHSVFFAMVLIPAVYVLALRFDRVELGTAFVLGHVSHLLADIPPSVATNGVSELTFLFWPVLEQPEYESVGGILDGFLRYSMGGYEWAQLGLFFLMIVVWYRDGMPGLTYVRLTIARYVPVGR
ncbi:metal-dependent hydrolase [Natronoglomus mannanivorans]|uniref:Metal-dependent hydrolase n=1 Tax=Natronoglomus mannanivorans TaxID=2979990 RepID=A0AAP3E1P1_9EURY|nr:metal-dependent hydrolase [Halobacteria archaeon AArc-xg1-1]